VNAGNLIVLASALANLALGGFVLWRRHTRPSHFAFVFFACTTAAWNAAVFCTSVASTQEAVNWTGRAAFAAAVLTLIGCLEFSWHFPERYHPQPPRWLMTAVLVLGASLFVLCFTRQIQASVRYDAHGWRPVLGPLHPLFVVFMVCTFGWSVFNLLFSRFRTLPGRERMQLNYCLLGLFLSVIPAYLHFFVIQVLTKAPDYYIIGSASTLCWTSFTFYAIFRHRLFDIGVALRNLLQCGLAALFFALLLSGLLLFYQHYLAGDHPYLQLLVLLLIGVTLAITVPPSLQLLTQFVDHRLFSGRYDYQAAVDRFLGRLSRAVSRQDVARLLAEEAPAILQATNAAVYLTAVPGENDLLLAAWNGPAGGQPAFHLDGAWPLLAAAHRQPGVLRREEYLTRNRPNTAAEQLAAAFDQVKAEAVCPLLHQNQFFGFLTMGERHNHTLYAASDLRLITAVVAHAAVALDNARLYEEASAARRHYEVILRHMQRGVLSAGRDGRIITLNETGAQILGTTPEASTGQPLDRFSPELAEHLQFALMDSHDQPLQEFRLTVAGRSIPCGCETAILRDLRNRISGALLVFEDLTEKKRFNEQVRRMDRLASVGTLAAGMAHEIKNPLVSIQTFVQLLPERHTDPEFREGFGQVVLHEVSRINTLVQNLLEFARPRSIRKEPVAVHSLVERSLLLLAAEMRKKGIRVTRALAAEPLTAVADSEQLHQVFFNLVQNAVHALDGHPDASLTVATAVKAAPTGADGAGQIIVSFKDNGKGISAEDLPRIFDPFFSTKENGYGLGLSICHGILHELGGNIEVSSTENEGSIFTVSLPAWTNTADLAAEEAACRVS